MSSWPTWGDLLPFLTALVGVLGTTGGLLWICIRVVEKLVRGALEECKLHPSELTTRAMEDLYDRMKANDFKHLEDRFQILDHRFTAIDDRFATVDDRLATIDDRLATVDNRFTVIDERFTVIDERFTAIDDRLDRAAADRRDREARLTANIRTMEERLTMLIVDRRQAQGT